MDDFSIALDHPPTIRTLLASSPLTACQLADKLGISQAMVWATLDDIDDDIAVQQIFQHALEALTLWLAHGLCAVLGENDATDPT